MGDSKIPSLQFYPADWRKDPGVRALNLDDRMIWFEIVLLMHESPRRGVLLMPDGKAMPTTAIARNLGLLKQRVDRAIKVITEFGVCGQDEETGAITNRRMIRDEAIRQARAAGGHAGKEHGSKGAEYGIKGGRPRTATGDQASLLNPPSTREQKPPLKPPPSSSPSPSGRKGRESSFVPIHSSQPRKGGSDGRTNERTPPEDYQRFWGPVEKHLRNSMVPERFAVFEGITVLDMTATEVVLAVQQEYIDREGGVENAEFDLERRISPTDFLRGRRLRLKSITDTIRESLQR